MRIKNGLLFAGVLSIILLPVGPADSRTPWFGGSAKAEVINIQLPATIKVALIHSRHPITIGCTGRYSYGGLKKGKPVIVSSKSRLRVSRGKKGMLVGSKVYTASVLVSPVEPDDHLLLNGRAYRGTLLLRPRGGVIDVIEQVGLEDYLYGVLPREVGTDWPVESLKAQAVISRTYVVANLGKSVSKGYDVTADVFSQVYGGLQDENPMSNAAVEATRGEILVDGQGVPVLTFFHSSCGGRTESPQYVWREIQSPPEYLESVSDSFCKDDPFYNWQFEMKAETLQKRLRKVGYRGGPIKKVTVLKTSPSGRAWMFAVDSARGRTQIQGNSFRLAVGADALRSTLLTEIKQKGHAFRFEGHGWGHGVGLCQWGARGRAQAGHSYTKILDAYYPKVRLVKAGSQDRENASTQAREEVK